MNRFQDPLIFWQNIPSIHQGPFLRELAQLVESVQIITEEDVSQERASQGWSRPSFGRTSLHVGPSRQFCEATVRRRDAVQVFSGLRQTRWLRHYLDASISSRCRVGVYAEAGRRDSKLGLIARLILYRFIALRHRENIDFILALGRRGVEFYKAAGFRADRIFEFAYFLDPNPEEADAIGRDADNEASGHHIAFVGSHIPLKSFRALLCALPHLPASVRLTSVGHGSLLQDHQALASQLSVASQVRWIERLSPTEVRDLLRGVDLLVLPSRSDGWGAVISEALLAGTPVICTSACGAATLLSSPELGEVISKPSVGLLVEAIRRQIERGQPDELRRRAIRQHAEATISSSAGAAYFQAILDHVYHAAQRPTPPWRFPPMGVRAPERPGG